MTVTRAQVTALPKAELHLHIEGTLEPELAFELAARNGVALSYRDVEALRGAYSFSDLGSFLGLYYECMAVLRTAEDFADLASAYLARARADGVTRVEMFFDPQVHLSRGVPLTEVIGGLRTAADRSAAGGGPEVGLIACFLRDRGPDDAAKTLDELSPHAAQLLAVGLDSAEVGFPPGDFARVFDAARGLGLHTVAHAGEEGPPDYVWQAIDLLGVERVDHGIRSVEDPALLRRLAADGDPADGLPAVQRPPPLRPRDRRAPAADPARRRRQRHDQLRRPGLLRRLRRRQLPGDRLRPRPRSHRPHRPGRQLRQRLPPLTPAANPAPPRAKPRPLPTRPARLTHARPRHCHPRSLPGLTHARPRPLANRCDPQPRNSHTPLWPQLTRVNPWPQRVVAARPSTQSVFRLGVPATRSSHVDACRRLANARGDPNGTRSRRGTTVAPDRSEKSALPCRF